MDHDGKKNLSRRYRATSESRLPSLNTRPPIPAPSNQRVRTASRSSSQRRTTPTRQSSTTTPEQGTSDGQGTSSTPSSTPTSKPSTETSPYHLPPIVSRPIPSNAQQSDFVSPWSRVFLPTLQNDHVVRERERELRQSHLSSQSFPPTGPPTGPPAVPRRKLSIRASSQANTQNDAPTPDQQKPPKTLEDRIEDIHFERRNDFSFKKALKDLFPFIKRLNTVIVEEEKNQCTIKILMNFGSMLVVVKRIFFNDTVKTGVALIRYESSQDVIGSIYSTPFHEVVGKVLTLVLADERILGERVGIRKIIDELEIHFCGDSIDAESSYPLYSALRHVMDKLGPVGFPVATKSILWAAKIPAQLEYFQFLLWKLDVTQLEMINIDWIGESEYKMSSTLLRTIQSVSQKIKSLNEEFPRHIRLRGNLRVEKDDFQFFWFSNLFDITMTPPRSHEQVFAYLCYLLSRQFKKIQFKFMVGVGAYDREMLKTELQRHGGLEKEPGSAEIYFKREFQRFQRVEFHETDDMVTIEYQFTAAGLRSRPRRLTTGDL
uniref:Uncharacterized protein n=1 Tax=Caenorhabditis japonica TaxID=281687 RepID=A0A8R1IEH0_CAEJA